MYQSVQLFVGSTESTNLCDFHGTWFVDPGAHIKGREMPLLIMVMYWNCQKKLATVTEFYIQTPPI